MSAPQYSELGKKARDVFAKGYTYDSAKIKQFISKKPYGFEFGGALDLKSFKATGSLQAQQEIEGYGEISTKYESQGLLVGEYKLKRIAESLDLNLGCSYNPTDTSCTCKLGGAFYNAHLHATTSLTKDHERSPDLFCTAVAKLASNIFLGYQSGYNTSASQFTKNDLAFAFEEENLGVHLRCIQISKEFGLSAFYKVNDKTDVAMDSKIATTIQGDSRPWFLGIGVAHQLDEQCKLRLKIDKNLQLGTCLSLKLQENLKVRLAFNLDLPNLTSGRHKIGLGLECTG